MTKIPLSTSAFGKLPRMCLNFSVDLDFPRWRFSRKVDSNLVSLFYCIGSNFVTLSRLMRLGESQGVMKLYAGYASRCRCSYACVSDDVGAFMQIIFSCANGKPRYSDGKTHESCATDVSIDVWLFHDSRKKCSQHRAS